MNPFKLTGRFRNEMIRSWFTEKVIWIGVFILFLLQAFVIYVYGAKQIDRERNYVQDRCGEQGGGEAKPTWSETVTDNYTHTKYFCVLEKE